MLYSYYTVLFPFVGPFLDWEGIQVLVQNTSTAGVFKMVKGHGERERKKVGA